MLLLFVYVMDAINQQMEMHQVDQMLTMLKFSLIVVAQMDLFGLFLQGDLVHIPQPPQYDQILLTQLRPIAEKFKICKSK